MSNFTLQDTGAYLEDFLENLAAFCEAHREDLSPAPTQPLRGIYRSAPNSGLESYPSSASIVLIPLGWEEESQTPAERYLRLRVELHLFYSGLHEGQRLAGLLAWADKMVQTFMKHRADFEGTGNSPYLHDLILTPLELLGGSRGESRGKILLVGLKKAKK